MNNKQLGTDFENKVVELLSRHGYWVHFLSPDKRGAQPFDVIAVKDDFAIAVDCKTCKDKYFRISRLEENQKLAFDKWLACGNELAFLIVEHNDKIHMIEYERLKKEGKVNLEEE